LPVCLGVVIFSNNVWEREQELEEGSWYDLRGPWIPVRWSFERVLKLNVGGGKHREAQYYIPYRILNKTFIFELYIYDRASLSTNFEMALKHSREEGAAN